MAIRNLRVGSYTTARHTISGRLSARLSTGEFVAIAFDVAGSQPNIHLYSAPDDNSAWTLRTTIPANNGATAAPQAWTFGAICVDDSDNIHLVGSTWNTAGVSSPGVSYWKLTKGAGLTWTASAQTSLTVPGIFQRDSVGVDIDFVGAGANGRAIVAVSATTGTNAYCRYYLMNGLTAVLLATPGSTTPAGAAQVSSYFPIRSAAISGRHQNETDNTLVFLYVYLTGNGAYGYALAKTNNTGTTTVAYGFGAFGDTAARRVQMSWASDREIILSVSTSLSRVKVVRFAWDATTYALTQNANYFFTVPNAQAWKDFGWIQFAVSRNIVAYYYPSADSSGVSVVYMDLSTGILSPMLVFDNFSNLSAVRISLVTTVHGNFNRALERAQMNPGVIADYVTKTNPTKTTYGNIALRAATVPSGLVPAQAATVDTDVPALAANVGIDSFGSQSDSKVTWQFATDINFTTPLASTFQWVNPGGTAKKFLESVSKLPSQGTWYFRAKTTDRYGRNSAWSPVQYFIDSHLPVALPRLPTGDQILPWNGGVVGLDWDFADTSPTATQSAYQVVVIQTSDGTPVFDTGIVASGASAAVLTLPIGAKDIELAWTVTLWDDQGVQGVPIPFQTFYASDPPSPAITGPTSGQVVTSGIVTVAWTSGISGVKTQTKYRVVLQEGNSVIHDSGTKAGNAINYRLPVGTIHNGHAYSVSVTTWDSLNLSGSANVAFSASFSLPASPNGFKVYSYFFAKRGFAWIGWDNGSVSADFVQYNVYRRAVGDSDWALLETVYENLPFYGVSDYEAAANVAYQYAVTQVVNSGGTGDFVESDFSNAISVTFSSTHYWIIDPAKTVQPLPIYQVTADSYTDEYERSTYTVIGRGRHTDEGEHLGINGSLTTQARDHATDQPTAISNCFADPAFQHNSPYTPEWGITFANGGSVINVAPQECAPSAHETVIRLDTAGTNAKVTLAQKTPKGMVTGPGDKFTVSTYLADLLFAYRLKVSFVISWLDSAGATISTQNIDAAIIEDWQGNTNWMRYSATGFCNVPTGTVMSTLANVQIVISDTAASGISILLDAAMANYGALAPYGDADTPGWNWDGPADISAAYTTGYYTARDQRKDLQDLIDKALPTLKLRTPFGDVWNVALQDIGFSRTAGTGNKVEYGDMTIPYLEQAN